MALELSTPDELVYQFNPVTTGSLHFKIRAANDGHIALTSGPEEADPMYEVFIGGWSNSKSVIRRNRTKPDVAEAATPDVLSANEFRGFWISWDNGKIEVGHEGQDVAFLEYTDPDPFGIGYYGVCTGWGATGTWLIEGSPTEISTIDGGDCLSYTFRPIRQGRVEFEVRTPSNAHIALTNGPKETEPMYEIMLGAYENTISLLRYNRQQPDKVREDTLNIVSMGEFRRFVVTWEEGRIEIQHKDKKLLEWTDPNPIGISYYGVRTGWGASGVWRIQPIDLRRITRATTQPGWNIPTGTTGATGTWVDAAGGEVPAGAVPGGFDGEQIYIARANHEGAMIPGKLVPGHGVTYISWGGAEHGKAEYQVLCGISPSWVAAKDGEIPPGALPGGQSEEGEQLYVGRVDMNGAVSLGKVHPSHGVCYIPYAGEELSYPDYEILVVN